ncbi:polyubiquitin-like [Quillaja saponaria]|uniref:Polyubiquitin-like n=1 Tax=Quillaja saponaria TaxID=32244 RepID=A0AAD7LAU7_QUISA|nr:polyubiquitin-like [Quillaja saponaria]
MERPSPWMQELLTPSGEIVKLVVKLLFTAHDVKAMVGSMISVSVSGWKLVLAGKQLEDCRTLAYYDIREGFVLKMLPSEIQVFVKTWSGKTITLDVYQCDTVEVVKMKFFQKMKMRSCLLRLVFAGKHLENGRNLASYNIQKALYSP